MQQPVGLYLAVLQARYTEYLLKEEKRPGFKITGDSLSSDDKKALMQLLDIRKAIQAGKR